MDESEPGIPWVFLVDPAWKPSVADEEVPDTAVLGGWRGEAPVGDFQVNPGYQQSWPDSATDPVDAALRLALEGVVDGDVVVSTMRATTLSVALDGEGSAAVAAAPDDAVSVLIATAPEHRARVAAADWVEFSAVELADVLPDEGIDVLINPGAPSSMRLVAKALKEATAEDDPPSPDVTGQPDVAGQPAVAGQPDADKALKEATAEDDLPAPDVAGQPAVAGQPDADLAPPTDEVHAVLRRLAAGEAEIDELRPLLLAAPCDVAMADGRPLTGEQALTGEQGGPALLLTTAESHRSRVEAQDWQRADLTEVATMLPDGVDVVLNPGDEDSVRLSGEFIRETVLLGYGAAVG